MAYHAYLIKCRKDIISKLDFCNSSCTCSCQADAKSHNALFTEWRVKNSVFS